MNIILFKIHDLRGQLSTWASREPNVRKIIINKNSVLSPHIQYQICDIGRPLVRL